MEEVGRSDRSRDRRNRQLKVKTTIDEALMQVEKNRDHYVADIAKKIVIDTWEKCVEKGYHGAVRAEASSAIRLIVTDVINQSAVV